MSKEVQQNDWLLRGDTTAGRTISPATANMPLKFGASDSAGVLKAMDVELYGSTYVRKLALDASANTLVATGISISQQVSIVAANDAPSSVTSTPGTAQTAALTVTGGVGGATTNASGVGGVGGGFALTAGAGGVSSGATAPTGGAGGALTATLGAGAACSVAASGNSIGGAGGAATVTTGAGGAVSGAVAGTATGGASGAISLLTGTGGAVTATTGTNVGGASGIVTIGSGTGGAASGATDTGGASGAVTVKTGTGGAGDTGGASGVLTLQTGAAGAGGSPTVGHIAFAPGAAEKWRMTSVGVLTSVAGTPANAATADGSVLATGGIAFTDVANAWIDDASQGSGTVAHYIGNQTITTSSDRRLKKNIRPTERDSFDIVRRLSNMVMDFTWDDPTDRHNPHGKHSRGAYMGLIAQDMIDVAPWAVNAPGDSKTCSACKAGQECREHSEQYWFAEYQYLVPPLLKVVGALVSRVETLEAKLLAAGA